MICPKCKNVLTKINNTYKCPLNHSYDIAKEGYVNLLLSKTNSGDNKNLVNARINFLEKDFYKPLLNKLVDIFNTYNFKNICDLGCGTGYYTNELSKYFNMYGLDISKEAIKHASKKNKDITYIVSNNNNICYEDNYFDALLHIFSPIFENEDKRVLKDNGYLIDVTPGAYHLFEVKNLLYKNPYLNENRTPVFNNFDLKETINLKYEINCNIDDINNLIAMTPYSYKTDSNVIENLKLNSDYLKVTIDFDILIYKLKA